MRASTSAYLQLTLQAGRCMGFYQDVAKVVVGRPLSCQEESLHPMISFRECGQEHLRIYQHLKVSFLQVPQLLMHTCSYSSASRQLGFYQDVAKVVVGRPLSCQEESLYPMTCII